MNISDFDIAFDLMGTDITFGLTSFKGMFDCPDEIIGGMSISPDYVVTTKTLNVTSVTEGSVFVINGENYEVRKVLKIDDGQLARVTLSIL